MDKSSKIIIIAACISAVLLGVMGWIFLSALFTMPDSIRGLQLNSMYMHTNDGKYPTITNMGKETVFILRFYDENNATIMITREFWNGSCCALPPGKFVGLMMEGQQFYSHDIYVEFLDGYSCKIGEF